MRARSSFAALLVLVLLTLPFAALRGAASTPTNAPDTTTAAAGTPADAVPDVAPGNAHFQRTWQRTDAPVADGSVARTWMWGPEANTPVLQETYAESPGGQRDVQYYDKSRMEITHPDAVDDGVWYVTNGLLVVELMTGQLQTGDNSFTPRAPSTDNVAGDADDPTGPTYATFAGLRSATPLADGATITQRVARDGTVTDDPSLAAQGVTVGQRVQVPGIDHQIAQPFWDFMTSSGLVDEQGQRVTDSLFPNPFYATGYPETEPYWADVKVAGTYRLVLTQCFERRCLTYTPGNPAGFVVEAGNVGQHYHHWRYATAASVVINEALYWPASGGAQWIELHNGTSAPQPLSGWSLTNAARSRSVALPAWSLPAGGYLLVTFGDGPNDADLSDGCGVYYAGAANANPFAIAQDGAALYTGAPGANTLADYVGWSYTGNAAPGGAYADAVAAGQWTADTFVPGTSPPQLDAPMSAPVDAGDSIGRDARGSDSNLPADWRGAGGQDAYGPTPCAPNTHGALFSDQSLAAQRVLLAEPRRAWTVMVYMDGRTTDLLPHWAQQLNELERDAVAGSPVNVVAQLAFPAGSLIPAMRWALNTPDSDIGAITTPGLDVARAGDPTSPGDPAALAAFITWAKTNYPADHYAIILAGHGEGWEGTMLGGNDFLTPSQLSTGLGALGQQFDDVLFESCMMGAVEIGAQIAPQAHYMVASEEYSWASWPLSDMVTALRAHTTWTPRQFADDSATRLEAHYSAQAAATGSADYQLRAIAAVNLDALASTLVPAVDALSNALLLDLVEVQYHDDPQDNNQITIKHNVQEKAEAFNHHDFKDLGDVARLVLTQPNLTHSQQPAQAVLDIIQHTNPAATPVISYFKAGSAHPHATGLSIYFPHDETLPEYRLLPNGAQWPFKAVPGNLDPCAIVDCVVVMAFDNPDHQDPATTDRHLYKRDAASLIPALAATNFPMRDDPNFSFPNLTHWDEFLHRYYKPVADACVEAGGSLCVKVRKVNVGDTVTLSGAGSSDSDGPENNDVPAHTTGAVVHYYWDMNTSVDHPDGLPTYVNGKLYTECGTDGNTEDCDRNNSDSPDDDLDRVGKTTTFTCATAGLFEMRLMVWDEEHDFERVGVEDMTVNAGRHWLHFNVDSSTVIVACENGNISRKYSFPDEVASGGNITYVIDLPANASLTAPSSASINDPLPAGLSYNGDLECSLPGCAFDAERDAVTWSGQLGPGDDLTLAFSAQLDDGFEFPDELQNCADADDGLVEELLCTETHITDGGPGLVATKTADPEVISNPEQTLEYTIMLPASRALDGPADAIINDNLPAGLVLAGDGDISCSFGDCGYYAPYDQVYWLGVLGPGETVTLTFRARLSGPPPPEVENCAIYLDGHAYGYACVTTEVAAPPSTDLPEAARP